MVDLTRRDALTLAVGAAAFPLLPAAANAAPITPAVPMFPIWEVGVEDYPNWRMIAAATMERAKQIFREENGGGLCEGCDGLRCAELDPDGADCEHAALEARRISEKCLAAETAEGDIAASKEQMKRVGWTHECERCHYDTPSDWEIVNDEAVCHDCMEMADWEIVNPKYAAELRAEKEEEFWLDFADTLQDFFGNSFPSERDTA